ncbi:MAG: hypothetical protein RI580_12340 [Halothece sp. Uz-M2-17]|nr:hypothetical protein [Halothece sp. Uz-M2-17]
MNNSLILELQSLASTPDTEIGSLLRKAMLVAGKLKLSDFRAWIDCELNGYGNRDVPEYRKTQCTLHVRNPYHGLQPLVTDNDSFADTLRKIAIKDPIGNLVHLLTESSDQMLIYPLPDSIVAKLMYLQGRCALPPIRLVSSGALATVIDCVRTTVLDWSINLENEGILGEGMVFSMEEKDKASKSQNIHIHSFSGILGDVSGSNQIEQRITQTINPGNFQALSDAVRQLGADETDITDLKSAIASDPQPTSSKDLGLQTRDWIGRMVSKAASGGLSVGVGAAGDLLAKAVLMYYGIE